MKLGDLKRYWSRSWRILESWFFSEKWRERFLQYLNVVFRGFPWFSNYFKFFLAVGVFFHPSKSTPRLPWDLKFNDPSNCWDSGPPSKAFSLGPFMSCLSQEKHLVDLMGIIPSIVGDYEHELLGMPAWPAGMGFFGMGSDFRSGISRVRSFSEELMLVSIFQKNKNNHHLVAARS